jgi:hypothetical protein
VTQTLDHRIEEALPILARIQQQGTDMKEVLAELNYFGKNLPKSGTSTFKRFEVDYDLRRYLKDSSNPADSTFGDLIAEENPLNGGAQFNGLYIKKATVNKLIEVINVVFY